MRHRVVGSVLLALLPATVLVLLLLPTVRRPLGRTLATIAADVFGSTGGDLRLAASGCDGLRPGHPVYLADAAEAAGGEGGVRPVAYVTRAEADAVHVRFAPDVAGAGAWRLRVLAAPEGLGDAWQVAVPPDTASDLEARLTARLQRLLDEVVLPEVEARLPNFLARVDPREDERAREVLETVGLAVLERVRPFADELAGRIIDDLEAHFGLLERMGLLWKVVRGDAEGLGDKLMPVAQESARRWWAERSDAVVSAVGEGLAATAPTWRDWLLHEVWDAAREELAEPLLAARRPELERAAEGALGDLLDAVVRSPTGGFRVRFAAVLRSRLLEKDEPLLLLERAP